MSTTTSDMDTPRGEVAEWRIEVIGGVSFLYGSVPISALSRLTKGQPKGSIFYPQLASRYGASMAFGPADLCEAALAKAPPRSVVTEEARRCSLDDGAVAWIATGEHGASSLFMLAHLSGYGKHGRSAAYPHDPDDLRRCRLLLEASPGLAARFSEMAGAGDSWRRLVGNWEEICSTMDAETPQWRDGKGRASATYALMTSVLKGGA